LAGLSRLKSLVTRNPFAPKEIEPLIGEAVHLVVHIARTPEGRRVEGILKVSGYENGHYITRNL
jgi:type IV secretion system protein VirB11